MHDTVSAIGAGALALGFMTAEAAQVVLPADVFLPPPVATETVFDPEAGAGRVVADSDVDDQPERSALRLSGQVLPREVPGGEDLVFSIDVDAYAVLFTLDSTARMTSWGFLEGELVFERTDSLGPFVIAPSPVAFSAMAAATSAPLPPSEVFLDDLRASYSLDFLIPASMLTSPADLELVFTVMSDDAGYGELNVANPRLQSVDGSFDTFARLEVPLPGAGWAFLTGLAALRLRGRFSG